MGGSVKAIKAGFIQEEIEEAAYRFQQEIEREERIIVGVNQYQLDADAPVPIQEIDAEVQSKREGQVQRFRENRNQKDTDAALFTLVQTARGEQNLFPVVLDAFRRKATLGEICGVLRDEWGEYKG